MLMTVEEERRLCDIITTACGPELQEPLTDPLVTEVRINPDGRVWKSVLGKGKSFTGHTIPQARTTQIVQAIAYSVKSVCNEATPDISAEMPISGYRFQGILPPLVSSSTLVIRKKAVRIFPLPELVEQGVLSREASSFVEQSVSDRRNIIVAGGTDSGKTTFTNALLDIVRSTRDRVVILEDTQELQCKAEDVLYMRTVDGVRTLRDLVRITMRVSPDRIIIGEVRGGEALDLLKSWNTGHSGGVSTVHASSAAGALSRLEQLVLEGGVSWARGLISEAINVVVYMEKVGTARVVKEIVEVSGLKDNEFQICTKWKKS